MRFFALWVFMNMNLCGLAQIGPGSWQNELGSVLQIDSISQEGRLYGVYKSSSGVDGRIFQMEGWVNSQPDIPTITISFTVRWAGYGSITSWAGYFDTDEDGTYMKTMWHLVRPNTTEPWERIITNSSTFRPLE